jgi:hypothetical protein
MEEQQMDIDMQGTLIENMKALRELKATQTELDNRAVGLRAFVHEVVSEYGPISTEYGNATISKPTKTVSYEKKLVEQVEKMLEVLAQTSDAVKPIYETIQQAKSVSERAGSLRITFHGEE